MSTSAQSLVPFDATLTQELTHFLALEAHLLDSHRLDAWLDLYAEDATYWVPLVQGQTDPFEHSSIIHDDRTLLAIRVAQYSHPRAHARLPVTRTCHHIGNVLVLEQTDAFIRVASTLTLVEYRQARQRLWGALVEHRLRRTAQGWQIAAKRVDLVNAESELDGISILF